MPVVTDSRLKIAVFVDFDNIEIGVKSTLGTQFDVGVVLEAIKERGDIVTKIAYGDWKRAGDHSRALGQHAVRLVQRNLTPGGDKNGADINLALDALEMALTHTHINAYVIVGGDSDFITLVEKLKQYDKQVFIVGGRQFTSIILQKNCNEFIAYENLLAPQGGRHGRERPRPVTQGTQPSQPPAVGQTPLSSGFPLVQRALGILSEREVSPQLGLLKSTLLQLDSTFSERDYGSSSFRDFVDKLAEAGLVTLNQSGRSVFVELTAEPSSEAMVEEPAPAPPSRPAAEPVVAEESEGQSAVQAPAAVDVIGTAEDAVRVVRGALERAVAARWPMYIRNVKQIVKSIEPSFDERRYGLGGVLNLLRACQRDGLLRLERDRKGALRVFQGTGYPRPMDQGPEGGVAEGEVVPAQVPEPGIGQVGAGCEPPIVEPVIDIEPFAETPRDAEQPVAASVEPGAGTTAKPARSAARRRRRPASSRTAPAEAPAAGPEPPSKPARAKKPAAVRARPRKVAAAKGEK